MLARRRRTPRGSPKTEKAADVGSFATRSQSVSADVHPGVALVQGGLGMKDGHGCLERRAFSRNPCADREDRGEHPRYLGPSSASTRDGRIGPTRRRRSDASRPGALRPVARVGEGIRPANRHANVEGHRRAGIPDREGALSRRHCPVTTPRPSLTPAGSRRTGQLSARNPGRSSTSRFTIFSGSNSSARPQHALGHRLGGRAPDVGRRGQPVRRHDHVVEGQQRVVLGERLDLENIEALAARSAAIACCFDQAAAWSTFSPRATLMR